MGTSSPQTPKQYPTRKVFARTVSTWLENWLEGRMGEKEFRARLAAIAECPVMEEPVPEREGWRD